MEVNDILSIVYAVIVVLVSTYLVPFLKTKLEKEGRENLIKLIETFVSAAEQVYNGVKMGEKKKEYVVDALVKEGIVVTESVDAMIEAAVYSLDDKKEE